jgi:rRNA maturation RNase YbeY
MVIISGSSRYKANRKVLQETIEHLLDTHHIDPANTLNVVFVGRRKMKEIAETYKHENIALPILAFPYHETNTEGERLLGEIFICYPQAVLLAAERNKKVQDMLNQLVEHGIKNIITNSSTPL